MSDFRDGQSSDEPDSKRTASTGALLTTLRQLREQIRTNQIAMQQDQKTIQEQMTARASLEEALKIYQNENQSLRDQIKDFSRRQRETVTELSSLVFLLESTATDFQPGQSKLSEMSETDLLHSLSARTHGLHTEILTVRQRSSDLSKQVETLTLQLADAKHESIRMQSVADRGGLVEASLADAREELSELQAQLDICTADAQSRAVENASLQNRVRELESDCANKDKTIEMLRSELARMKERLTFAEDDAASKSSHQTAGSSKLQHQRSLSTTHIIDQLRTASNSQSTGSSKGAQQQQPQQASKPPARKRNPLLENNSEEITQQFDDASLSLPLTAEFLHAHNTSAHEGGSVLEAQLSPEYLLHEHIPTLDVDDEMSSVTSLTSSHLSVVSPHGGGDRQHEVPTRDRESVGGRSKSVVSLMSGGGSDAPFRASSGLIVQNANTSSPPSSIHSFPAMDSDASTDVQLLDAHQEALLNLERMALADEQSEAQGKQTQDHTSPQPAHGSTQTTAVRLASGPTSAEFPQRRSGAESGGVIPIEDVMEGDGDYPYLDITADSSPQSDRSQRRKQDLVSSRGDFPALRAMLGQLQPGQQVAFPIPVASLSPKSPSRQRRNSQPTPIALTASDLLGSTGGSSDPRPDHSRQRNSESMDNTFSQMFSNSAKLNSTAGSTGTRAKRSLTASLGGTGGGGGGGSASWLDSPDPWGHMQSQTRVLKMQVKQEKEKFEKLERQHRLLADEAENVSRKLKKCENEFVMWRTRAQNAERKCFGLEGKIAQMGEGFGAFESTVMAVKQKHEEKIEELEMQLEVAGNLIESLSADLLEKNKENEQLQQELNSRSDLEQLAQDTLTALKDRLNETEEALIATQDQIMAMEKRAKQYENEIQAEREARQAALASSEKEHQQQLQEERKKREAMQKELLEALRGQCEYLAPFAATAGGGDATATNVVGMTLSQLAASDSQFRPTSGRDDAKHQVPERDRDKGVSQQQQEATSSSAHKSQSEEFTAVSSAILSAKPHDESDKVVDGASSLLDWQRNLLDHFKKRVSDLEAKQEEMSARMRQVLGENLRLKLEKKSAAPPPPPPSTAECGTQMTKDEMAWCEEAESEAKARSKALLLEIRDLTAEVERLSKSNEYLRAKFGDEHKTSVELYVQTLQHQHEKQTTTAAAGSASAGSVAPTVTQPKPKKESTTVKQQPTPTANAPIISVKSTSTSKPKHVEKLSSSSGQSSTHQPTVSSTATTSSKPKAKTTDQPAHHVLTLSEKIASLANPTKPSPPAVTNSHQAPTTATKKPRKNSLLENQEPGFLESTTATTAPDTLPPAFEKCEPLETKQEISLPLSPQQHADTDEPQILEADVSISQNFGGGAQEPVEHSPPPLLTTDDHDGDRSASPSPSPPPPVDKRLLHLDLSKLKDGPANDNENSFVIFAPRQQHGGGDDETSPKSSDRSSALTQMFFNKPPPPLPPLPPPADSSFPPSFDQSYCDHDTTWDSEQSSFLGGAALEPPPPPPPLPSHFASGSPMDVRTFVIRNRQLHSPPDSPTNEREDATNRGAERFEEDEASPAHAISFLDQPDQSRRTIGTFETPQDSFDVGLPSPPRSQPTEDLMSPEPRTSQFSSNLFFNQPDSTPFKNGNSPPQEGTPRIVTPHSLQRRFSGSDLGRDTPTSYQLSVSGGDSDSDDEERRGHQNEYDISPLPTSRTDFSEGDILPDAHLHVQGLHFEQLRRSSTDQGEFDF